MIRYLLTLSIFFAIGLSELLAGEILMRFWAQDEYARPIGLDGRPTAETYTFYIGEYYPGANETEEEVIPFDTVARILVEELKKQNYLMSDDPQAADYILMINWGQTNPESEVEEVTSYIFDEEDVDEFTIEQVPEHVKRKNAALLGASNLYNSMSRISLKKELVEEAVVQDRYFINIFAVSIQNLMKRQSSDEKIQATWESQLSVPANKRDGIDAMKSMASTGSGYFGQNIDDLAVIKEGLKLGVVKIGEINFLEETEGPETETPDSEDSEIE